MKTAIIPAAGSGVRFHELGKSYPKCLLPYNGRPIICHTLDKLVEAGYDEIYVVKPPDTCQTSEIWNSIVNNYQQVIPVTMTFSKSPVHTIHWALIDADESSESLAESTDRVTVVLSDAHYLVDYAKLDCDTLGVIQVEDYSRWCMVKLDAEDTLTFYDKPEYRPETQFALCGIYHFDDPKLLYSLIARAVVADWAKTGELQISSILERYQDVKLERGQVGFKLEELAPKEYIDFGTLDHFLANRSISNCRSFNQIKVYPECVVKSALKGADAEKLFREACWMKHGPFTNMAPRVDTIRTAGYTMERLTGHNLRDLFLYYDRSEETWAPIMYGIRMFLEKCRGSLGEDNGVDFWAQIAEKNARRVNLSGCPLLEDRDVQFRAHALNEHILQASDLRRQASPFHGDLHLSNMFWQKGRLRFVDPMGQLWGHWLYDVAKLYHSFICGYDFVDSQLYTFDMLSGQARFYDHGVETPVQLFREMLDCLLDDWELDFVKTVTATLFYSMIPLHSHSKTNQAIYLSIANKLFDELNAPNTATE